MSYGNKLYTESDYFGEFYRSSRTWNGANDPAHKAENPYTAIIHRQQRSWVARVNIKTGVDEGNCYGPYYSAQTKPQFDSNTELQLLAKMADEIRGHSFNLGVFVAELRESLAMLLNSFSAIVTMAKALRHRDFGLLLLSVANVAGGEQIQRRFVNDKRLRKAVSTGNISSTWLAIQYGWKPLVNDIFEACKAIEALTSEPRTLRARFSAQGPSYPFDDLSTDIRPNPTKFIHWCSSRREYRLKWVEKVSIPRSLGLINPLTIAWERLPWSFVIDWFMPIGSYLDLVGFFGGLQLSYAQSTFIQTRGNKRVTNNCGAVPGESPHSEGTCYIGQYYKTTSHYHYCGGTSVVNTFFDRVTGTTLRVPTPDLKDLDKAFSLGHLKNAAALVWQRTRSTEKYLRD
ncbi:maturation protein [ssRNA phage SRR7976327_1]|uniref:Maturation protein n=1 Tax=ssRNA phage SRR7976327_1 TaxID=2786730 RepID=A0A8S5KZT9_9VIRU|nr:maturation protein [ssRNA phage SRR7976327_1]DAD51222.1 TPA_asm: maturation protein [ssRNA phage SRR7976327_1]